MAEAVGHDLVLHITVLLSRREHVACCCLVKIANVKLEYIVMH